MLSTDQTRLVEHAASLLQPHEHDVFTRNAETLIGAAIVDALILALGNHGVAVGRRWFAAHAPSQPPRAQRRAVERYARIMHAGR
jgi:hypothetical protein